jgi:hypothetical protein
MRCIARVAALLVLAASARADQREKSSDALLVDFVELSSTDRSVARNQAMVELVNESPMRLDVVIGPSGVSLEPKERVIARLPAGDVTATVKAPARTDIAPLEGPVRVEGGHRYELAFGFGPVAVVAADLQPGLDAGATSAHAATAGEVIAPKPMTATPARPSSSSGKQKVEIGRKRHGR